MTNKIRVKLYVIDLARYDAGSSTSHNRSTNGTYINGERIEAQRYVELKEKDILKFGERVCALYIYFIDVLTRNIFYIFKEYFYKATTPFDFSF